MYYLPLGLQDDSSRVSGQILSRNGWFSVCGDKDLTHKIHATLAMVCLYKVALVGLIWILQTLGYVLILLVVRQRVE